MRVRRVFPIWSEAVYDNQEEGEEADDEAEDRQEADHQEEGDEEEDSAARQEALSVSFTL